MTNDRCGATIWARKTIDSEIFYNKPDKWFKIWFFLVSRVNHQKYRQWNKGECFTTYAEIMEVTGATKDQVSKCLIWLKSDSMLATQKATRGIHIRVLNYAKYQDLSYYKSNAESKTEAKQKQNRSSTRNKNDKNDKNDKYTSEPSSQAVSLKKKKEKSPKKEEPFILIHEIEKLEENNRRDLNIIALYFRQRKTQLQNKAQMQTAIRRHLRSAKELIPFTDDQLLKACARAKSEYPEIWTLETLVKILTK